MRKIFVSFDSITGIIDNSTMMEKIKPCIFGFPRLHGSCYRVPRPLGVAPLRCPYAPKTLQIYIFIL